MNILGALIGFLLVLLIGVPLALLTVSTLSPLLVPLAALSQPLLVGFLAIYVFGVFSGFALKVLSAS